MVDKWDELKVFVTNQYNNLDSDKGGCDRLLKGFFKTIKDKMYSLEIKEEKQKKNVLNGGNKNG